MRAAVDQGQSEMVTSGNGVAEVAVKDKPAKEEHLAVLSGPQSLPLADLMRHASEVSGRSLHQILSEMTRLAFGPGKIMTEEYFALSLFDEEQLAGADKRAFVGLRAERPIWHYVNYRHDWTGFIDDKLAVEAMLSGAGFPTTKTLAMFGSNRNQGNIERLRTPEDIKRFLRECDQYPLFGKPMSSLRSLGAVSYDSIDIAADELINSVGERVSIQSFVDEVIGKYADGYIFQKKLAPHRDVAEVCGERIATVRIVTLDAGDGAKFLRGAWKLPAGDSVADNYWRGNLLTSIDTDTGTVGKAFRLRNTWSEEVESHPDSGVPLKGFKLPMWKEMVGLAEDASSTLPNVPLIGWDIAVTDEGPVLIEPNHTPDFALHQIADRLGMLDERLELAVERGKKAARDLKKEAKVRERRDSRARMRDVITQSV